MSDLSEPVPASLGRPFRLFEWDDARGRAVIQLADGTSAGMPVTLPTTAEGAGIAHMVYSFADYTLTLTTPDGECATLEIEPPAGTAQHTSRRVVYLDQGHWSTLARRMHDPSSVAHRDAEAADKLIEWARDRCIILPLSSGHVIETTPLYGVKRQHLGLVMLKLSRGWHMRNPVLVRSSEIARVLGYEEADALGRDRLEVFTLDPDSLYAGATTPPAPTGLVEYLAWLCARLTAVAANFDLLIDPQRITPEKTTGWCDRLAATGRSAQFQALSAAQRRKAAHIMALNDALADADVFARIQGSGLAVEPTAAALLQGLQAQTDTMPFLRLYADALGVRLLNPTTRWEPNDLIDMLYLACAAAYADGVAAERTASRYLNTAWRDRPGPCPVVPTLGELVSHLTDLGLE
jgi:hypothetical protein